MTENVMSRFKLLLTRWTTSVGLLGASHMVHRCTTNFHNCLGPHLFFKAFVLDMKVISGWRFHGGMKSNLNMTLSI